MAAQRENPGSTKRGDEVWVESLITDPHRMSPKRTEVTPGGGKRTGSAEKKPRLACGKIRWGLEFSPVRKNVPKKKNQGQKIRFNNPLISGEAAEKGRLKQEIN